MFFLAPPSPLITVSFSLCLLQQQTPAQAGAIESDFALSISLFHAYELLLQHGLRSFYHFLSHTLCGVAGGQSRAKLELSRSVGFNLIMNRLEGQLTKGEGVASCQGDAPFFYSHPKLNKLEEVVLEHFHTAANSETRVMIFSQYRESVQEITDMLVRHAPLVRVMSFVGHANSGRMNRGLTHKEQTMVRHLCFYEDWPKHCLLYMCRLYKSFVTVATMHWCQPVLVKKGLTLGRWT